MTDTTAIRASWERLDEAQQELAFSVTQTIVWWKMAMVDILDVELALLSVEDDPAIREHIDAVIDHLS